MITHYQSVRKCSISTMTCILATYLWLKFNTQTRTFYTIVKNHHPNLLYLQDNDSKNNQEFTKIYYILKRYRVTFIICEYVIISEKVYKKRSEKVILIDYFTFDDFYSFERVDFFSVVVNFRC